MGGRILDLDWIRAWKEAKGKGKEEGKEEGITIFIADKREDGIPDDVIKQKLKKHYSFTDEEAEKYLKKKSATEATG